MIIIKEEELLSKVIEAVRKGGYTNVYITDKGEFIVSNASKEYIEFSGHNVIYTIECASSGDMNYEKEEDFTIEDAEIYVESDIESISQIEDVKIISLVEVYENLMEKVNLDNVEFAILYAQTKKEVITKLKEYAKLNEKEDIEEDMENKNYEIRFTGPGYYDIWGYEFTKDLVLANIEDILESEVDYIEAYLDTENVINDILEDASYVYGIFGVQINTSKLHLEYIVYSDKEIDDVFEVLKAKGVSPNAWGTSAIVDDFYNYYVLEISEKNKAIDPEDLRQFMKQKGENDIETMYLFS